MDEGRGSQPDAMVPRGTCKLFGAIKALSTIQKSVCLVHGPKGCVYHINYILGMRGDLPPEIYTTCLDEHDVIFGAEEKLRRAIGDLERTLRPDLIFVLSCCTSSLIGEDVASVVRDSEADCPVIPISSGGFEGDFHEGYRETLCQLARTFARKAERVEPGTVNLVGVLRGGPDLAELRGMLGTIGARVNTVLTAGAGRSDLERLGTAALNIVLCEPAGKEAALLLHTLCGTPFIVEEIPIGRRSTIGFLERVAKSLSLPSSSIPHGWREDPVSMIPRRIAVVGGPTRAVSVTRFLAGHGVPPCLVSLDFDPFGSGEKIRPLLPDGGEVLIEPPHALLTRALVELEIDLLIGGMLELPLAHALGIAHVDIMHGSQKTLGCAGEKNLLDLVQRAGKGRGVGPGGIRERCGNHPVHREAGGIPNACVPPPTPADRSAGRKPPHRPAPSPRPWYRKRAGEAGARLDKRRSS